MLDNENGVPSVRKRLQNVNKLVDVGGVKSGGRLVKNVDSTSRGAFGKLRGKLDALSLASRKCGCGLTYFDVPKTYVLQGSELAGKLGNVGEKLRSLVNGHLKHVVYGLALIVNVKGLAVIALSFADLAWNIYVGQEVHFYLDYSVSFAGFAPSALYVEREPSAGVSFHFRVVGVGKKVADIGENSRVGGRIGAGRSSYGGLVDGYYFVKVFKTVHSLEASRANFGAVELSGKVFVDYLVYQRGFSAARNSSNAGESSQRYGNVNIFQIMFGGADNIQSKAVSCAPFIGYGYKPLAAEVLSRNGFLAGFDVVYRTCAYDLSAVYARVRTDVNNIVGCVHSVLVMLYYNKGVAKITEALQGGYQLVVVPLMKTY